MFIWAWVKITKRAETIKATVGEQSQCFVHSFVSIIEEETLARCCKRTRQWRNHQCKPASIRLVHPGRFALFYHVCSPSAYWDVFWVLRATNHRVPPAVHQLPVSTVAFIDRTFPAFKALTFLGTDKVYGEISGTPPSTSRRTRSTGGGP